MLAADTMREYGLSNPWPPEGRLWAQKGPKMAKNRIQKIEFFQALPVLPSESRTESLGNSQFS